MCIPKEADEIDSQVEQSLRCTKLDITHTHQRLFGKKREEGHFDIDDAPAARMMENHVAF